MKRYFKKISIFTFMLILISIYLSPQTILANSNKGPGNNNGNRPQSGQYTLTIMHTNDSHGRVEQRPKLATAVKLVRGEKSNSLLLDAGDVFYGTEYFNKFQGLADLDLMNDLQYDAMTLGNHEFDIGFPPLANFIRKMNFPMLSANVNMSSVPELYELFSNEIYKGQNDGVKNIYPAMIKELNGQKVGIIGLTTIYYNFPPIIFESVYTKASETIALLMQQGVNKIIVLSHLGTTVDEKLATRVNGIDVIVGGHNHTVMQTPWVIEKIEPTVIVQAGQYLDYLGVLDVTFNPNGIITSTSGKLLNLHTYSPDPVAQAKVDQYKYLLLQ